MHTGAPAGAWLAASAPARSGSKDHFDDDIGPSPVLRIHLRLKFL
jgi:hypothetical protein